MSAGSPGKGGGVAEGDGLVFRWEREGVAPAVKLAGFVALSVAIHAGFFYLFRVVYPSSERVLPTPVEVLLLSEESPGVPSLLRALDDRDAAYHSSVRESVSGGLDLGSYGAVYGEGEAKEMVELGYQPSYSRHDPMLLPWPQAPEWVELPALTEKGTVPILPQKDEPALPGTKPDSPERQGGEISVLRGGGLESREIEAIPDIEASEWGESGTGRVVFMVGIGRSGRVIYRLPTDRGGLPEVGEVSAFVGQIVFEAGESQGPEINWGMIEVVW